jgi:uncharacterized protein with beta-barrel porin domain
VNFNDQGTSSGILGIINNANAGQTISIENNLRGIGAQVQQLGNSTLILSGRNDYTGATTVSAGTLKITSTGVVASYVTIAGGATLSNSGRMTGPVNNYSDFTPMKGSITNAGTFANNPGATVSGDLTNTGGTVTNGGTWTGDATNSGTIANNNVWTGAIANAGAFANNAGATISGLLNNTGGAVTNSGTWNGDATNSATLINNNVWTGTITNAATFANNAGATVSGLLTNTGGTTTNNGALNGGATVSGGTFTGTGTVTNLTVSGGTFAPGNATPGTSMAVTGNLAFQSGAVYLVQLNPTTSTFANVTGIASLNGSAGAAFLTGSYVAKQYTILTAAGGVGGTFSSFDTLGMPSGFTSTLSYGANNVILDLHLGFSPPTQLNANQQNVANALVNFFNNTGGIPAVFANLTAAGLTQVAGETATGSQQTTFNAMGMFMGMLTDPFIAGRGDLVSAGAGVTPFAAEDEALAYASNGKARSKSERDAYAAIYRKAPVMADPFTQRWSVWAAGYGGSQTTDGNAVQGTNNTRSSIGGVAVGADYRFSPHTIAGFALAGGATNFSVNGLGSGRSDLFQAGAFVRHNVGAAYLTGALAYGWQDITTDRTVTVAGTDMLRAQFNANAFSGRAEGGYRFATPWVGGVGITPYAAGQFVTFDLPAYAEQAIAGVNTFALSYAGKSVTDTRSELGLRTDKSFAMQSGIFTLRGRAAWAHDFNTDRSITPTFQTLPGASFVVNGAAPAHDSALVTASAEMKWLNGFSLAGTFEGEFSNVTTSYAGKGVVRYAW